MPDLATLQGLVLYTLYLLRRLRFFQWQDTRRVPILFQKYISSPVNANRSIVHESDCNSDNDNDDEEEEAVESHYLLLQRQRHSPQPKHYEFSPAPLENISLNDKLSPEILSLIFDRLEPDLRSLRRCTLVCRTWYELLGPRIWRAPRVLWSKHWSRFHPVTLITPSPMHTPSILSPFLSTPSTPDTNPQSEEADNFIENLKLRQVSRKDLLTAMSLDLIHEADRQELIEWFEWEKEERKKRIKAQNRKRQGVKERNTLLSQRMRGSFITDHMVDNQDDSTEEEDEGDVEDNEDETDDSDYDDIVGDDGSDDEILSVEESDEDSDTDLEYDASDDETPLMKLVSGMDYLQSFFSRNNNRPESQSSSNQTCGTKSSILSNPFTNTIARVRKRQIARETRQRLAQLRGYDGLPSLLPLQTCGRWIQEINLHQETSIMQSHPVQDPLFQSTASATHHPFEPNNTQTYFPHLEQQEPPHQQGLFASFIDALTHNPRSFESQFRGRKGEMRLRSRREFVTDKTLKTILETCPRLRSLTISECHGITDNGLKLIRNSECVAQGTLVSLHMAECYQITDQGLLNLVGHSENNNNHQGSQFSSLPRFESLDIAGCHQITNQGLAPLLVQCGNKLIQLRAHDCLNITFKSVLAIAEYCHRIQWLDLGRTGTINEACLIQLASNCLDLEWISLSRSNPNNRQDSGDLDEGFNESELEQNDEEGGNDQEIFQDPDTTIDPPISDYSIALICESCTKLQLLDVSYIPTITNTAIESLSQTAKSLVYLTIIGCPGITSQALYYLAALRNTSGKLGCITMGDALGISEKDIENIMQGTLSGWQKSTIDETSLGNILSRNWG